MARRRSVVLAVVALVLALAACGAGTSRLTKAQYRTRVSQLCLLAADQFREMHLVNTIGDWRYNATKIVHMRVRFNKALAALKPPLAIASKAAAVLGASKNALADDRRVIAAARAGDDAGFGHALGAQKSDQLFALRSEMAIGATGCESVGV
jgi:hypothetical protein